MATAAPAPVSTVDGPLDVAVPMPPVPPDKKLFINIEKLNKHFGEKHVLRGIDLHVYHGETVAILGTSGGGKTTMIKHLMGSLPIEEGHIHVGDQDLAVLDAAGWERYRQRLGVVFQNAALLGSLSILENVGLPLIEVERLPMSEVRPRVIEALKSVFLSEDILEAKPDSLSGGMRKRVGIARAIIQKPELILYDEPTTGLDSVTTTGVNELTKELQKTLKITSLIITHDLHGAFSTADRVAVLYRGRIIAFGTPDELKASKHPVVVQLLSGSTTGPLTENAKGKP